MLLKTSNYNYRRIKHPNVVVPAEKVPHHCLGVVYREGLQVEVEVGCPMYASSYGYRPGNEDSS